MGSNNQVVTNGWGDCAVSATSACQTESIQVPTCTTTSGPRPGQSCVFPFRHLGIVYTACTSSISSGICLVTAAAQQLKDEDLGRLCLAPPPPPLLAECGPGGHSRRCQKYHSISQRE